MPMTEQGFQKMTYAEILEQQIIRARKLFGDDIDTSEKSVLGKYIRLNVSDFAQQEEALESLYLSRYIDTAYGISLDRLAPFAGIKRNAASYSMISVRMKNNGNFAAVIPMNTKLISGNGILYHTVSRTSIPAEEELYIAAECDDPGAEGNALSGRLKFRSTQIPNVEILSSKLSSAGTDTETDSALRERWKKAITGSGSGTASAVIGKVLRVSGAEECILTENNTDDFMQSAGENIPPHSFHVCVYADESVSADIAQAIFDSKPLGIGTVGNTVISVRDAAGIYHDVSFSFAKLIPVYAAITISREEEPDFDLESDGDLLKKSASDYINLHSRIGRNFSASSLYVPVMTSGCVSSVQSISIGRSSGSTGAKLTMESNEKAICTPENIAIVIV